MNQDDLSGLLIETGSNAFVSWIIIIILYFTLIITAVESVFDWTFFVGLAITILVVPAIVHRDPRVMPPWELVVIVAAPLLWHILLGHAFVTDVPTYLAIAALALVFAVELHQFTAVRMNRLFALVLVALTTLAVAGVWHVLHWLADVTLGTTVMLDGRSQDAINRDVMIDFIYASIAGIGGSLVFELYFRTRDRTPSERTYVPPRPLPDNHVQESTQTLSDRLGIGLRHQKRISIAMQVVLGAVLITGIYTRDLPTIANAVIALVITFIPAVFERQYAVPMDAGLVLWITSAVFLHALGSVGFYASIGPWDNLTHALSASIVAAAGYTFFRAIHVHTDDIFIPSKIMGAFILIFVLAAGVIWEIFEFIIDQTAIVFGLDAVLAQYGINDTINDLFFNSVGAIIVTLWGTAYLTDISDSISDRLNHWFGAD